MSIRQHLNLDLNNVKFVNKRCLNSLQTNQIIRLTLMNNHVFVTNTLHFNGAVFKKNITTLLTAKFLLMDYSNHSTLLIYMFVNLLPIKPKLFAVAVLKMKI